MGPDKTVAASLSPSGRSLGTRLLAVFGRNLSAGRRTNGRRAVVNEVCRTSWGSLGLIYLLGRAGYMKQVYVLVYLGMCI
jgi:hypothetical protein